MKKLARAIFVNPDLTYTIQLVDLSTGSYIGLPQLAISIRDARMLIPSNAIKISRNVIKEQSCLEIWWE